MDISWQVDHLDQITRKVHGADSNFTLSFKFLEFGMISILGSRLNTTTNTTTTRPLPT